MTRSLPGFFPAIVLAAALVFASALRGLAAPITRASDVRSLSVAEADKGPDVHLRGVVVFVEHTAIFVQDETSTTFFRPTEKQLSIRPGDVVEVRGKARMGLYLPGLGEAEIRVLGRGALPAGIPAGYDDITTARYHYQRVAVEGIIRSIELTPENRSVLRLAIGSRSLEVRVELPPPAGNSLIDSRVRITGLAAGFTNSRRQLVQTYVRVQHWGEVEILDPATPAAAVPRISAAELLAFRPSGPVERRIGIAGVVTAVFPDGELYLRQGDMAFAAKLATPASVSVGENVELLGFPEMAQFTASVVDAEIVHREPGATPDPLDAGRPDALNGTHHARLVTLSARLADSFKTPDGVMLVLPDQTRTIQAHVLGADERLEPGSLIRVTGICHVEGRPGTGFSSQVGAISLRVRSPADVVVLRSPTWWTPRRFAMVLSALVGVTFLAGLWIAVLRRQVRRQTEALRERIESEAALEERQRIAREFHDSLEQDLTGLGLRLDAAATRAFDDKGRQIIEVSRGLLARIQGETKNFVSDLRDIAQLDSDLATALEGVAANHGRGSDVDVRTEFAAPLPPLSGGSIHHLRMVARESITNALKHAGATRILIHADVSDGQLVLRVTDNGRGFDVAAETLGKSGHFGCVGIRERARKLGARVAWHSTPGGGTTVELILPLARQTLARIDATAGTSAPVAARASERNQPVL